MDRRKYSTGRKVRTEEMKRVKLQLNRFNGQRNDVIHPNRSWLRSSFIYDFLRRTQSNHHFEHPGADALIPSIPFVRSGRKIGRNEPCPCGSGLKYKNCHGRIQDA